MRLLAAVCAVLLAAGGGLFVRGGVASAAEIAAVTDITVTQPDGTGAWDGGHLNVDWCVPNGTQAGDTFTVELPSWMVVANGLTFDLPDPANGSVVATAVVSGQVVTFTMTAYAETHINVCGTAWLRVDWGDSANFGGTNPYSFTVNGVSNQFPGSISIDPKFGDPNAADKFGDYSIIPDPSLPANDHIAWGAYTRTLTSTDIGNTVTIQDTAPSGAGWVFDCATVFSVYHTTAGVWIDVLDPSAYTVTCSPTSLAFTATVTAAMVGYQLAVEIYAAPTLALPSYVNTAEITYSFGGSDEVSAQADVAVGGGSGSGGVGSVSIGDFVWWDQDEDGVQDAGELPASGVTVNLQDSSGTQIASTTTDASGFYSFTNLWPSTDYRVEFVAPSGASFTTQTAGGDTAVDSNADISTGLASVTTPASGSNSATAPDVPTIDAGLVQSIDSVSVGDFVWWDQDRDGVQDSGELPVSGVTVNLQDSSGTQIASTTTDVSGFYSFIDLLPSTDYRVEFVAPLGASFTTQTAGGDTAVDSNPAVATGLALVTTPASGNNSATVPDDPTIDAGIVQSIDLSLVKSLSSTGAFHPGSTVTFTLTPHNNGPADAAAGWSVTEVLPAGLTLVSMSGTGYACAGVTCTASAGLASGADGAVISVTATVDVGVTGSLHNVAYVSPASGDWTETNLLAVPVTSTDTSTSSTNNDAQASLTVSPVVVSVGDFVWWDQDEDGVQDAGELPVSGVTVNLQDLSGTQIASTTTDVSGFYSFIDLLPSTDYRVEFVAPSGASFTTQTAGGDTAVDSNPAVATGLALVTTPASGNNSATVPDDPTIDAGLVQSIDLSLVKSLTSTGAFHPGSTVTFTLTPHNNGPADAAAGWSVTEVLPAGLTLVSMSGTGYACAGVTCTASAGLASGADGAVISVTATVDAGVTGSLHNVAYVSPASGDWTETNLLAVPVTSTDTSTSSTNNDAQATLTVSPVEVTTTTTTTTTPTTSTTTTAPSRTENGGQSRKGDTASNSADRVLAFTGVASWPIAIVGLVLAALGALMLVARRRRRI